MVARVSLLQQAHAAVLDDPGEALRLLLTAWQDHPAAELADAIEVVGKRAARGIHPPTGVSAEDREQAWFAAAHRNDPVERHVLVQTVTDVLGSEGKIARAQALVETRDPRVGAKLVELLADRKITVLYHVPEYWRPLFVLLEKCGDPRVVAAFADPAWRRLSASRTQKHTAFELRARKVEARLAAAYPGGVPALPDEERAIARAIIELATAPEPESATETRAALLAAIYASPDEDGPRQIYADWLQERGDPRGEFIALQLAVFGALQNDKAAERERIRELLAQHETKWLGTLAGRLHYPGFHRGFLANCKVEGDPPDEDPAWSTLTTVHGGLPIPTPALRDALELGPSSLVRLGGLAEPPPLRRLSWRHERDDWNRETGYLPQTREAIDAFARVLPKIPTLRALYLAGSASWAAQGMTPAQLEWPWRGTQITELRVSAALAQLEAWLLVAIDSQLETFEMGGPKYTYTWRIHLDKAARKLSIDRCYHRQTFDEDLVSFVEAIAALPRDYLRELRLDAPAKDCWSLPNRRTMSVAIASHPSARLDIRGYTPPKR